MKIENKLILSNIINGAFIILIGFFAFQNMNLVLTKLRFVEIADDLNASFLEMRLSEKNYFLYQDSKALAEIREKITDTMETIEGEKKRHHPGRSAKRTSRTLDSHPEGLCRYDRGRRAGTRHPGSRNWRRSITGGGKKTEGIFPIPSPIWNGNG